MTLHAPSFLRAAFASLGGEGTTKRERRNEVNNDDDDDDDDDDNDDDEDESESRLRIASGLTGEGSPT